MQLNDVSTPAFELGTWVGRRQALGLIANKCSAADAECLKQTRGSKRYKSVAAHWEDSARAISAKGRRLLPGCAVFVGRHLYR